MSLCFGTSFGEFLFIGPWSNSMIKCLSHNQLKMIPKNVKNHSNCASGITSFGPMEVVGITTSMIAWENGMGRALGGMGGARSSTARSLACCKLLCSCSLVLRSFSLLTCDAARSTKKRSWSTLDTATACWRARIVSIICCRVTFSPPSATVDPCLVLHILLVNS